MTGCGDIASALYRQGTKKAVGLRMSNDYIPGYEVKVFNSETLSPGEVSVKGKKFVLALDGGQRLATLDEYRYYAYYRNIAIVSWWKKIFHQLSGDGGTCTSALTIFIVTVLWMLLSVCLCVCLLHIIYV